MDDAMLLDMLHQVFERADPVPDEVMAAARALFGRRSVSVAAGDAPTDPTDLV